MVIELRGTAEEFRAFVDRLPVCIPENPVLAGLIAEIEDQLESAADPDYDYVSLTDLLRY